MKVDDPDPIQLWQSISAWYAEFASMHNWEYLIPMVALTTWIGEQPFATNLYPSTSHEWLCVHLVPGFNRDQSFFSCCVKAGGEFECEAWAKVGQSLCRKSVPLDQDRMLFTEFVGKLTGADA